VLWPDNTLKSVMPVVIVATSVTPRRRPWPKMNHVHRRTFEVSESICVTMRPYITGLARPYVRPSVRPSVCPIRALNSRKWWKRSIIIMISFSCVITNYSHVNILLLLFDLFYVYNSFLLYCYYYSVMYVTVMPVCAYVDLAFVFGFIQIN